jgi:hypothetical protein
MRAGFIGAVLSATTFAQ